MVYPAMIPTPERRHIITYDNNYSIPEGGLEQICSENLLIIRLQPAPERTHKGCAYLVSSKHGRPVRICFVVQCL